MIGVVDNQVQTSLRWSCCLLDLQPDVARCQSFFVVMFLASIEMLRANKSRGANLGLGSLIFMSVSVEVPESHPWKLVWTLSSLFLGCSAKMGLSPLYCTSRDMKTIISILSPGRDEFQTL
jgi:hypothetical protein